VLRTAIAIFLAFVSGSAGALAQGVSLSGPPAELVSLKAELRNATVAPGDETVLAVHVSVDSRYHIQSNKPLDDFTIPTVLTVEGPEGFRVSGIRYPEHVLKEFAFAKGKKVAVLENESVITATITAPAEARPGDYPLKAVLEFQPCDDNQCLPPDTAETTVVLKVGAETSPASASGAVGADAAASVQRQQDEAGAPEGNYFQGIVERNGWLVLLIAIYIAGLGLSLTPCVFPLIPVTLGYFRGQASDDRRRTILLALTYVAGIATTYSVLGVLAASSGALFGSWLSSPWVLGALAAIIAAMGISMFGAFELRPPAFLASRSGAKAGFAGAFVMGLLFGVVAAPCTGPATIALLAFVGALAKPIVGLVLFFVLAIGISTPLLLLAIFSANLPQSGVWMNWIKKLMGALMLGVAVWLLSPVIGGKTAVTVGGVLSIVLGLYLGFVEKSGFSPKALAVLRIATGVVAIAAGIWMLVPRAQAPGIEWQPYSADMVRQAAAEAQPVILDFSAEWCAPCHELDAGAFRHPEVVERSKDFVRLRVDVTDSRSPEVKKVLAEYDVRGVPSVLFISPEGKEVREARIEANVPGRKVLESMSKAAAPGDASKR